MARTDKYTDETLMAYADGELSAEEAQQLEQAMTETPALRDRVAMFERQRTMARAAYADVMSEPVPDRLLEALKAKPQTGWRQWFGSGWRWSAMPAGRGMATALLLVAVGIGAGIFGPALLGLRSGGQELAGSFNVARIDARLASVLEKTASDKRVEFTDAGARIAIAIRSTFRRQDGQACRDYEQRSRGSSSHIMVSGVACRDNSGQWRSVVAIAAPLNAGSANLGFRPASSGLSDLIDAVQDKIIDGAPLSTEAEARLLKNGWQAK